MNQGPKVFVPPPTEFSEDYFGNLEELEDLHPWTRAMRTFTLELLRRKARGPIRQVLDVGCGNGLFLCEWKQQGQIQRAVGIDLFPAALRRAKRRCEAAWIAASAAALPFAPASFDAIHSGDVIQHLSFEEARAAFDAFAELLRPGGWLALRVRAPFLFGAAQDADYSISFPPRRLRSELNSRGFLVRFLSRANALPSLWTEMGGSADSSPQSTSPVKGIKYRGEADTRSKLLSLYLRIERSLLLNTEIALPAGHTTVCLAQKRK